MKLAEVLWGPEAWCQGAYENGQKHCLMGAAAIAAGLVSARDGGSFTFTGYHRLRKIIGGRDDCVSPWNDDPARTWEEVAVVVDEYDRLTMLEELRSEATVTP